MSFDTVGRVVEEAYGYGAWDDPRGLVADPSYNPDGFLTKRTSYADTGEILSETDDRGNTTSYGHDALGRRMQVSCADGSSEQAAYRTDGLVSSLTALGRQSQWLFTITSDYDAAGDADVPGRRSR